MASQELVDFVKRLQDSGIKISFTKPKAKFSSLQKNEKSYTFYPQ